MSVIIVSMIQRMQFMLKKCVHARIGKRSNVIVCEFQRMDVMVIVVMVVMVVMIMLGGSDRGSGR